MPTAELIREKLVRTLRISTRCDAHRMQHPAGPAGQAQEGAAPAPVAGGVDVQGVAVGHGGAQGGGALPVEGLQCGQEAVATGRGRQERQCLRISRALSVPPASVVSRRVLLFWSLKVRPQSEQCSCSATKSTCGGVPRRRVERAILSPDQPALRACSNSRVSARQSPLSCRLRAARSGRKRPAPGPDGWWGVVLQAAGRLSGECAKMVDGDMQEGAEFAVGAAVLGFADQAPDGLGEGAVAGEADVADGEQAEAVEAGRVTAGPEPAVVVVAAQIGDLPEAAEGGGAGGLQGLLELTEGDGRAGGQQGDENVGGAPGHTATAYVQGAQLAYTVARLGGELSPDRIQPETTGISWPGRCE